MTTQEIEQKLNASTVEITKIFDNIEINRERIAKISGEDLAPEISAARELCAMIGRTSIADRNGFCRVRVARAVGAAFGIPGACKSGSTRRTASQLCARKSRNAKRKGRRAVTDNDLLTYVERDAGEVVRHGRNAGITHYTTGYFVAGVRDRLNDPDALEQFGADIIAGADAWREHTRGKTPESRSAFAMVQSLFDVAFVIKEEARARRKWRRANARA